MNKSKNKMTKEYQDRHNSGQFFTSSSLVEFMSQYLNIQYDNKSILEPSFGGCAFIDYIVNNSKNSKITAVDIDKKLCKQFNEIYPNVNFICYDFLTLDLREKFDIVIGNPPFNLKTTSNYYDSTEGFLLKGMDLLKEGGHLYFVMPSTILRNKQYQNLRNTLIKNYSILNIINTCGYDFLGADIETIVIHLKKRKVDCQEYVYLKNNEEIVVNLEENERQTILLDNLKIYNNIVSKLSPKNLDSIFNIYRGKGTSKSSLHGRDLDFYSDFIKQINGNDLFIGLQNIAYRFTANTIMGSKKEISDTITMLIPKEKMDYKNLSFISEFLSSSVANYLLHTNAFNESRLTIHVDKYYIRDILIPNYDPSFEDYLEKNKSNKCTYEFGKIRNEYFYNLLNLNQEEIKIIENKWTYPRFKKKKVYLFS